MADRILAGEAEADFLFVDFHAEATSEKGAMGWYLDGRVQGCGAPTPRAHGGPPGPPPQGTGFVTDLGMTGPAQSILGVKPENSVAVLGPPPPAAGGGGRPQKGGRPLHHRHRHGAVPLGHPGGPGGPPPLTPNPCRHCRL